MPTTLQNIGRALAAAGYAATHENWLCAYLRSEPHEGALFDALDSFSAWEPEIEDRLTEARAELAAEESADAYFRELAKELEQ